MAEKNDKRMAEPNDSPNKGGRRQKPRNDRDPPAAEKEEANSGVKEIDFDPFRCGADRSTSPSQAEQVQGALVQMEIDADSKTEHSFSSETTQSSEEEEQTQRLLNLIEEWNSPAKVVNGKGYYDDETGRAIFEKEVREPFSLQHDPKMESERSPTPTTDNRHARKREAAEAERNNYFSPLADDEEEESSPSVQTTAASQPVMRNEPQAKRSHPITPSTQQKKMTATTQSLSGRGRGSRGGRGRGSPGGRGNPSIRSHFQTIKQGITKAFTPTNPSTEVGQSHPNLSDSDDSSDGTNSDTGNDESSMHTEESYPNPSGIFPARNSTGTVTINRPFLKRYDIKVKLPVSTPETAEQVLVEALQGVILDIWEGEPQAAFWPYSAGEKVTEKMIIKTEKDMPETLTHMQRFFQNAWPLPRGGERWLRLAVGHYKTPMMFATNIRWNFEKKGNGIWIRRVQAEEVKELGWFAWSMRIQDEGRVADMLSKQMGFKVGVRWRRVTINNQGPGSDSGNQAKALHIEVAKANVREALDYLSEHYGSDSTEFPDGTKMRFVPRFADLHNRESQEKAKKMKARQAAFTDRVKILTIFEIESLHGTFTAKDGSVMSLFDAIMSIESHTHPKVKVFHCCEYAYKQEEITKVAVIPQMEEEGFAMIASLMAYCKHTYGDACLSSFTARAQERSDAVEWDPVTRQAWSALDREMVKLALADEELDFEQKKVVVENPEVVAKRSKAPAATPRAAGTKAFTDNDSISTFNPIQKKNAPSQVTPSTRRATPSVSSSISLSTADHSAIIQGVSDVILPALEKRMKKVVQRYFEDFTNADDSTNTSRADLSSTEAAEDP
jgi:hypothetical protein